MYIVYPAVRCIDSSWASWPMGRELGEPFDPPSDHCEGGSKCGKLGPRGNRLDSPFSVKDTSMVQEWASHSTGRLVRPQDSRWIASGQEERGTSWRKSGWEFVTQELLCPLPRDGMSCLWCFVTQEEKRWWEEGKLENNIYSKRDQAFTWKTLFYTGKASYRYFESTCSSFFPGICHIGG